MRIHFMNIGLQIHHRSAPDGTLRKSKEGSKRFDGCRVTVPSSLLGSRLNETCLSDGESFSAESGVGTKREDREINVAQRVRGIKSDKKNRFELIVLVMTGGEIKAIARRSEPPDGPECVSDIWFFTELRACAHAREAMFQISLFSPRACMLRCAADAAESITVKRAAENDG